MGDFERTFGAGANIESIIDGINRDYFREQRKGARSHSGSARGGEPKLHQSGKQHFTSFQEAMAWAKRNPGKSITRSPDGEGFVEK
ncbi:hypothetical protein [Vreelandella glaciei]|uniref:hypothetical protein n=1 Tax=Vreelandella glaciei TaxID=186761 RepID=UPI0030ECA56C|tara:strand:- start:1746 stop:2003 length:258 start_codon:yes stop_codon:yes gene_type:complete